LVIVRQVALVATLLCLGACSGHAPGGESVVSEGHVALVSTLYRINCGAGAVAPFAADQFAVGGSQWSDNVSVATDNVSNAAPPTVYQSERYGNQTYTFPNLTAGASYTARLHFAETKWTTIGARKFNIVINGKQVQSNLDIFASAGAKKALVLDFSAAADSSGKIAIQYITVIENAKANGIEILNTDTSPRNQAPTLSVPASASVNPTTGTSVPLSVLGADDGGEDQLTYTWSTTGTPPGTVAFSSNGSNTAKSTIATFGKPGSYALLATIKDASGAAVTSSLTVVVNQASASAAYRINCGAGAVSPFAADQFANGGSTWADGSVVSTAGVANAAPAATYHSERYGNFTYTFGSLTAGSNYTARLHFAETKYTSSGARVFDVLINGARVLTNFDIFAAAGSKKALPLDFDVVASGTGQISVQFVSLVDNAKSSAIEILGEPAPSRQGPTLVTAASASPATISGTSSALSALGADDGGEAALTYTWSTVGTPPAAVGFSANASNQAKNTIATFSKAGSYSLSVSIKDAGGSLVNSSVNVVVSQTLTSLTVAPALAQVPTGTAQQFLATAKDQFGAALSAQPSVTWSVSGGGSISALGAFSAADTAGGPFRVQATSNATSGSASLTVISEAAASSAYSTDFNLNEGSISEAGRWLQNGLDWTPVVTANGLAYGTQSGKNGFDDSYAYLAGTFPANQSASAVIHLEAGISVTYQEVEILLRWRDSAHNSTGYECNLAYNGQYAEIIKWPGALGKQSSEYSFISSGNPVSGGVHDGDLFQADVIGNVITSRLNGRVIATGTDSSIPSGGAPGIGFYVEGAPASRRFSFTHFSGTGL